MKNYSSSKNTISYIENIRDNKFSSDAYSLAKKILNDMQFYVVIAQKIDDKLLIIFGNKAFCDFIGIDAISPSDSKLIDLSSIVSQKDAVKFREILGKAMSGANERGAYRIVNKDNQEVWHTASHVLVETDDKKFLTISYSNINEMVGIQRQLMADSVKWNKIVNRIPLGLAIFNIEKDYFTTIDVNDRLIDLSEEMSKALGDDGRKWTKEELSAIFNQDIFAFACEEDIPKIKDMLEESWDGKYSNCYFKLRGSTENNIIWIHSICAHYVNDDGKNIFYITFSNATSEMDNMIELQKSHEELKLVSRQDPLTGVMNRTVYNETIEKYKKCVLYNLGVIFADVNGLKTTNDTYGHVHGDKMICRFADILRQEFSDESINRISGDEFVIICFDITREAFINKAKHLIELVGKEDDIASIGYIWEEKVPSIKQSIQNAEQLMYVEKQHYYATQTDRVSKHRKKHVNKLMEEIDNGQFQMYLQPKSCIENSVIIGAEALVRKFDINGNLVFPDEFIPQLEQERLIPILDFFMLEEVCKTLDRWKKQNRRPIKISVNMSRVTLAENDFLENVMKICNSYDVDRSLLEFEITESTHTMNHNRLNEEVIFIQKEGFSVSLDDMGTDYSALRMLLMDGIDTVKLDRSFILQMDTVKGNTLLQYMIKMSHDLGLLCIAEGVEDDEQREKLRKMGCDMYQGYLLSKPIPVNAFERLLDNED